MKVVSVKADGSYFVNVLNRPEFYNYCANMIKQSFKDSNKARGYGFGYNGIEFGAIADFTQFCNFKKIPLTELPKVMNSIKTLIRSELTQFIEREGIDISLYPFINVEIVEGVCCGMAVKKFDNGGKLVRDYGQQWKDINDALYCGKRYTEKQFAQLKERKNQIYRKRQVMYMKVNIKFSKEDKSKVIV